MGMNDLADQQSDDFALDLKELDESFQNKLNHVHEVNNKLKH